MVYQVTMQLRNNETESGRFRSYIEATSAQAAIKKAERLYYPKAYAIAATVKEYKE